MRLWAWLILSAAVESVLAALPLSDGPEGMTCSFHMANVRANWLQRGGDWSDAAHAPYGELSISSVSIVPSSSRQTIEFDVTTLAKEWAAGEQPAGAIFLRAQPGRDGVVSFASRESDDARVRPELIIEWVGEKSVKSAPTADTTINCTTIKSLGDRPTISVGGGANAVLVFPFEPVPGRNIVSARLILVSEKQWGRGADIGVFRVTPPWVLKDVPAQGIATLYPGDKGIGSDPAVFFASGFDEQDWRHDWTTYGRASLADIVSSDTPNQFSAFQGKALRVRLTPEQNLGLDLRYDFEKKRIEEPEEAYMRYYLRFGENWNPTRDGGKLPGFAGTYNRGGWGLRKADGRNGWSARGAFFSNKSMGSAKSDFAGIGSYVYHVDIENAQSVTWGWGMGPTGLLKKNKWYSIEQYVRMNDPGKKNGILRAWIDGVLVLERTDLRFRSIPDIKIENAWFNVYHGGVEKPEEEMTLYIDNVVIAKKYIGPMSESK